MPWVIPTPTAAQPSSLLWEKIRGSWAFSLERHRTAADSTAGRMMLSLRRKMDGKSAHTHRIVLTDDAAHVVSYHCDAEDAERGWELVAERVLPPLEVYRRTYEDAKAVLLGLFRGAHAFLGPQAASGSVLSLTPFVIKSWQTVADIVPLHACWVPPRPRHIGASLLWRGMAENDFAVLERSTLPKESVSALWGVMGRPPPGLSRIRLRDRGGHVVASGGELEVGEAWETLDQIVVAAVCAPGVRPSDGWKAFACEMLLAYLAACIPSCIPPRPILEQGEPAGLAEVIGSAGGAGDPGLDQEARRFALFVYVRSLRAAGGWGCGGGWARREGLRMASFLEVEVGRKAPEHTKAGSAAVTSLPSVVTWWTLPKCGKHRPPEWRQLPSVVTWAPPPRGGTSTSDSEVGERAFQAPPATQGTVQWLGATMVRVWGQHLGDDSGEDLGGDDADDWERSFEVSGKWHKLRGDGGYEGKLLAQLLVFGACSSGAGGAGGSLDARAACAAVRAGDALTEGGGQSARGWENAILGSAYLSEALDGDPLAPTPIPGGRGGGWRVAAAAIGAGGLVVMTGGVALPVLAEMSVGSALAAGALGGTVAKAASSAAGNAMAGAGGSDFLLRPVPGLGAEGRKARGGLLVSGWLGEEEEPAALWGAAMGTLRTGGGGSREWCVVRWDVGAQRRLGEWMGKSGGGGMGSSLVGAAVRGVKATVERAVGTMLDDTWWAVGERADAAGTSLARLLASRSPRRPITLVGYGHGARLIFTCLLELASVGPEGRGIVDDVFLFGCTSFPLPADWGAARDVVAGRLVHGYCSQDVLLSKKMSANPAGTAPMGQPPCGVRAVRRNGVEDLDFQELRPSGSRTFTDYKGHLATCLSRASIEI